MSIAEAALYGNLVKYLRDTCALELVECQAEADALPFVGAGDPCVAAYIQRRRRWLDGDIPF